MQGMSRAEIVPSGKSNDVAETLQEASDWWPGKIVSHEDHRFDTQYHVDRIAKANRSFSAADMLETEVGVVVGSAGIFAGGLTAAAVLTAPPLGTSVAVAVLDVIVLLATIAVLLPSSREWHQVRRVKKLESAAEAMLSARTDFSGWPEPVRAALNMVRERAAAVEADWGSFEKGYRESVSELVGSADVFVKAYTDFREMNKFRNETSEGAAFLTVASNSSAFEEFEARLRSTGWETDGLLAVFKAENKRKDRRAEEYWAYVDAKKSAAKYGNNEIEANRFSSKMTRFMLEEKYKKNVDLLAEADQQIENVKLMLQKAATLRHEGQMEVLARRLDELAANRRHRTEVISKVKAELEFLTETPSRTTVPSYSSDIPDPAYTAPREVTAGTRFGTARNRHQQIAEAWTDIIVDPLNALTHSALFDVTQPRTAAWVEAYGKLCDHADNRVDPVFVDAADRDIYIELVGVAGRAWDAAVSYAERVRQNWLPEPQAKKARQAERLLAVASDQGASIEERATAAEKAANLLKSIHAIDMPETVLHSLAAVARKELSPAAS